MLVRHRMTRNPVTLTPQDTLATAQEKMAAGRFRRLPVMQDQILVGILTDRDVRDAYPSSLWLFHGKDIDEFGDSHTVEEVMTYNVVTVSPQTSLREATLQLRRQRFGALPVVEEGKLVGIITRSDLLDALLAGETLEA